MRFRERLKYAMQILTNTNSRSHLPARGAQHFDVKQMPFALPMWGRGTEIPALVNYNTYVNEGYKLNSIVYSCIRKISSTAPAAALTIERTVDGQREVSPNHPLLATFQNPNPHISEFSFKELCHTYMNLIGEVYIIKVGFGGRPGRPVKPGELYLPRPDLMHPVPGEKKLLGFVHRSIDGKRTPFLPDEVIHIKYPDPNDQYEGFGRGLAPLSAAALLTDVDNKTTVLLKDFFENGAIVSGLLKIKHRITDENEIAQLHKRLRDQYTGDHKWYDMILDADADYQRIGLNFNEMALPDLRMLTESRICSVFDVPAILVGAQVGLKNEAGFTTAWPEARKALWMDKIIPDNQRIADGLTMGLSNYLQDDEFVSHDYNKVQVLQENRTAQFDRAVNAWVNDLRTLNESRREMGDPPREDGDMLFSEYKRKFAVSPASGNATDTTIPPQQVGEA